MPFLRFLRQLLAFSLIAWTAAVLIVAHFTPQLMPEDLPWTPLDLRAPIGTATAAKLATLGGPACRTLLREAQIAFRPLPKVRAGACGYDDGVVLRAVADPSGASTRYLPAPPPLACALAAALIVWEREVVAPAAARDLGRHVTAIDHYGSYACRRLYGRANGDWSEHAGARAIDIAGFRLSDGRRISVAGDWSDPGTKGRFLHDVRDGACRLFATTLSPDYNAAHRDHLHLDEAVRGRWWRTCR